MPSWAIDATSVAVLREHPRGAEPAAALRARRRLHVQQPVVDAHVPVPPHRVVEARDRQPAASTHERPCPAQDRLEHHLVARVGEQRAVQQLVVGHGPARPHPDDLAGRSRSVGPGPGRSSRSTCRTSNALSCVQNWATGWSMPPSSVQRGRHARRGRAMPGRHRVGVLEPGLLAPGTTSIIDRIGSPPWSACVRRALNERPSRSRSTANVIGSRDVAGPQEVAVQRVREPVVARPSGRRRGAPARAPDRRTRARSGCGRLAPGERSGVPGSSSSRRTSSTGAVGSGSIVMDGSVSRGAAPERCPRGVCRSQGLSRRTC